MWKCSIWTWGWRWGWWNLCFYWCFTSIICLYLYETHESACLHTWLDSGLNSVLNVNLNGSTREMSLSLRRLYYIIFTTRWGWFIEVAYFAAALKYIQLKFIKDTKSIRRYGRLHCMTTPTHQTWIKDKSIWTRMNVNVIDMVGDWHCHSLDSNYI